MNAPEVGVGETVASLRARLRAVLARAGLDNVALETDLLLGHALGATRAELLAHPQQAVPAFAALHAAALVDRRTAGEPVAYLLGRRGFWTLELEVSPAVLIPRPETELLVQRALAHLPPQHPARVADLGTGSGAVALALAGERPEAALWATDRSAQALAMARRNARQHGCAAVHLVRADWLAPFTAGAFGLIAANPPYVQAGDPCLEAGDLRHEPRMALAAGMDGLDALRAIIAQAPPCLAPGGWLLLEHGATQGAAVRALMQQAGFTGILTTPDLAGLERVTEGCRP